MASAGYSCLLIPALIGVASVGPADAESGSTPGSKHHYDGVYGVNITTKHGDCDKHSHWTILVKGGSVSSVGSTPMSASGHINSEGKVHLTFRRFHHHATVTGMFTTSAGSGSWHSPSLECSGSWHAHRRS
jgi:hypothetical protein